MRIYVQPVYSWSSAEYGNPYGRFVKVFLAAAPNLVDPLKHMQEYSVGTDFPIVYSFIIICLLSAGFTHLLHIFLFRM